MLKLLYICINDNAVSGCDIYGLKTCIFSLPNVTSLIYVQNHLCRIILPWQRLFHGSFLCRCSGWQIFKVKREGEYQRYRPFEELPNRQLLWHGSRATNYAGILSQGLRIAPPEAPVVSPCKQHCPLLFRSSASALTTPSLLC